MTALTRVRTRAPKKTLSRSERTARTCIRFRASIQPKGGQLAFFHCLDLRHRPPDSGERQYKTRHRERRFDPALKEHALPLRPHRPHLLRLLRYSRYRSYTVLEP